MEKDIMHNYWIVGANVQDTDMAGPFIEGGFWFADQVSAQGNINEVKVGDCLVIKRGFAVADIEIKAIGIIKDIKSFESDLLGIQIFLVTG
jgi:hypothetical protein